ncbi:MAG: ABC transporter substrate-binding protein [Bradyrhizobium sp.]|jgi:putative ABC transport system substrate-binding protein
MRRRDFIVLLGGATTLGPLGVHAQHAQKPPRIGVLLPGTPESFSLRAKAFLGGLREFGYFEGRTIEIDWKWGQDRVQTFSDLAAELVRSNVDVIVTGGTSAAQALKAASATTPIVMAIIGDPVAAGLVSNLARPAGNLTGFSIVAPELGGKRLELLREIVDGLSSVGVLMNNRNPQSQIEFREMQSAAQAMGLRLYPTAVSTEVVLEDAFAAMNKAAVQALVVLTDPILFSQRKRIVTLANENRLPAMYFFQGFADEGGLLSYGPSDADLFRRAAGYVDRILKGTKPGDLPIEQPTKFELFVNLKTARMLGLIIPESFLLRADKVIE